MRESVSSLRFAICAVAALGGACGAKSVVVTRDNDAGAGSWCSGDNKLTVHHQQVQLTTVRGAQSAVPTESIRLLFDGPDHTEAYVEAIAPPGASVSAPLSLQLGGLPQGWEVDVDVLGVEGTLVEQYSSNSDSLQGWVKRSGTALSACVTASRQPSDPADVWMFGSAPY